MSKRRIPTNKQWFDYNKTKYCGWLFCFMSSSANFHERLYYPKRIFLEDLPLIKKFLGVSDKRTITKYVQMLLNNGYLSEDKDNYYFPFELHKDTYILIDKDLLYNLCVTKSTITTQVFCYLKSKLCMKQSVYCENTYNFTLKELRIALGYSAQTQNYRIEQAIKECLQTLKAENYIDYTNVYVDLSINGKCEKVPNYQLKYVCDCIPEPIQEIKDTERNIKTLLETATMTKCNVFYF